MPISFHMLNYFGFGKKIEEKIPSEIKVALHYKLFSVYTVYTAYLESNAHTVFTV